MFSSVPEFPDEDDRPGLHEPASVPTEREELERFQVDQAKAKDPGIWAQWFDAYYPHLFRYAYFRLRRRSDAQDVVSEVFLEAVRGIHRFQYTGRPVLAWLYRIAHNTIAERLRREQRRTDLKATEVWPSDFDPGPEESLKNIDLLKALGSLTDEQQEVITLRFLLGMPTREVAVLLGKTETAVFSLQARALRALRQRLTETRRK